MIKRIATLCLAVSTALLLTACSQQTATATPSIGVTTAALASPALSLFPTPTTTVPITTITPSPTPSPGVTEKRIGFVRKVYTKNAINYIDIDYVDFLTGQAAIDKAKEDGNAQQDENGNFYIDDYYISNDSKKLRTFALESGCTIELVDLSGTGSEIPMKSITFAKLKTMGPSFDDAELLMHIDVKAGYVHSLKEQYRP